MRCGDELIGKQASKIKQLRGLWRDTDIESVEKGCEIKELKDVVIALRNDINNLQKELDKINNNYDQLISNTAKEIEEFVERVNLKN